MIKTKFIEVEYGFSNYQEIDVLINDFIQQNELIDIIDIKLQNLEKKMIIEFIKEVGMAILWLFLGYLIGERNTRKDKEDDK